MIDWPAAVYVVGLALLERESAAMPTVVVAVEVLLPGVLSLGDETVAVLVIVPGEPGAVTLMTMLGVVAPEARLAARVHVTVSGEPPE